MMTTQELVNYYANLLILQYLQKPNAYATIQTLVAPALLPQVSTQAVIFSLEPASGAFAFKYGSLATTAISWDATASDIQTALRLISGLSEVTVSGSLADQSLVVTFNGVTPPALDLTTFANSLQDGSSAAIDISVTSTDITLPLAVQNAFNLTTATGVQLDVLGKYVGVTRNGNTFQGPITLNDADFSILIRLAIFQNNAGSSLYDIQQLIANFFPGQILVFDYQTMRLSYFLNVGSTALVQMVLEQKILPKPMGVQLGATIYAPVIDSFFGFRTYAAPGVNNTPFNDYNDYIMTWPWLDYADAIII